MDAAMQRARLAGWLYLLMVPVGLFSLMYVSPKVAAKRSAAETAANLLTNDTLIRVDLLVGLFTTVLFMLVGLSLYQLLKDVDRQQAAVMAILVLIQLPNAYLVQLLQLAALELAHGQGVLSGIDQTHRESLALLCSHFNDKAMILSEFFWGIWLIPLGTLVYRSRFLPRFIGVWLWVNGVAYILMCIMNLFTPQYTDVVFKLAFPAMLGELVLTLGLLYVGYRAKPSPLAAHS